MPDKEVKTIQDLIYYQYAKVIARSAMGADAKKKSYGFVKTKFRELRDNEIKWPEILREDKQLVDAERRCIYCGTEEDLQWEHIVPKSLKINDRCPTCKKIQAIHNQVLACKRCNSSKGTKGLYQFYCELYPDNKKFYDQIPALVEKKYLKAIWWCHRCNGTLEWNGDGNDLDVFDLDLM